MVLMMVSNDLSRALLEVMGFPLSCPQSDKFSLSAFTRTRGVVQQAIG